MFVLSTLEQSWKYSLYYKQIQIFLQSLKTPRDLA